MNYTKMLFYKKLARTTFLSMWYDRLIVGMCLLASGFLEGGGLMAAEQVNGGGATEASAPRPQKHLRIAYNFTNAQYRQQLFELTPLGSSYERVKVFSQNELLTETYPSHSIFDPGFTKHRYNQLIINVYTRLIKEVVGYSELNKQYIQKEAPKAKIILTNHGFIEGANYMNMYFTAKPSLLGPWIEIFVVYVFDREQTLIDIYCFTQGRSFNVP